jgi:hypothetical protein
MRRGGLCAGAEPELEARPAPARGLSGERLCWCAPEGGTLPQWEEPRVVLDRGREC